MIKLTDEKLLSVLRIGVYTEIAYIVVAVIVLSYFLIIGESI